MQSKHDTTRCLLAPATGGTPWVQPAKGCSLQRGAACLLLRCGRSAFTQALQRAGTEHRQPETWKISCPGCCCNMPVCLVSADVPLLGSAARATLGEGVGGGRGGSSTTRTFFVSASKDIKQSDPWSRIPLNFLSKIICDNLPKRSP